MSPVLLGEWLLELRKSSGLALAELSSRTKINPRYLDALERGDMETLPTRVHARAFALAYARACDADDEEALEKVEAAFHTPLPGAMAPKALQPSQGQDGDLRAAPSRKTQDRFQGRIWAGLALGVLACFWGLNIFVKRLHAPAPSRPPAAVQALARPQMGEAAALAAAVTPSVQSEGDTLALRSRRPCWVVLQVDGKRLPTILLEPNVKEQWQVRGKAVMMAGNIGAVRVWWRGENLGYFGELGERMNGVVFEVGQPWRKDSSQDLALPPGVPSQASARSGP